MSRMYNPPHPGAVLKDGVFADTDITVSAAAQQLGVSRVGLSRILNGKSGISAGMALRLAEWLGTSPEVWVNMQTAYDLWQAGHRLRPKIKPLKRAA